MNLRVMLALFAALLVSAVADTAPSAADAQAAHSACLEIAGAVESASPALEDKQQESAAFEQCRKRRPQDGFGLAAQATAVDEDCHELARLYHMARKFGHQGFSAADFCTSALPGAEEPKQMDRGACKQGVAQVLASHEVGLAAEQACLHVYTRGNGASAPLAAASACKEYGVALARAPADHAVDADRLCDDLLKLTAAAGPVSAPVAAAATAAAAPRSAAKASPASAEEGHFVGSCVQYAVGVLSTMVDSNADATAETVRKNCELHLASKEGPFCDGYSNLVRHRAAKDEFSKFCDEQYQRMHEKAPSATTPAPPQQAPKQAPASQAPATVNLAAAAQAKAAGCEKHLAELRDLQLAPAEATRVLQADCPKRFKTSADVCDKLSQLFAAGKTTEACRLVTAPPAPKPPKHAAVDMAAVCRKSAAKATAVGLDGEALRRAAAGVCVSEVQKSMPGSASARARKGCDFFAQRLAAAQETGSLDVPKFCATLHAKAPAAKTQQALRGAAQERDVQPHVHQEETKAKIVPVASASGHIPGATQPGDEDFLNSFLNEFDDPDPAKATALNARAARVRSEASALFGSPPPPPPAPTKPPARRPTSFLMEPTDDDSDSGAGGPFLASFLDRYGDGDADKQQAKPKPLAAAIQEISDGEDVWSGADTPEAGVVPMAAPGAPSDGESDVGALVASFLTGPQ